MSGAEIWVYGTVTSLPQSSPDNIRFQFSPTTRQAELAGLPSRFQVRWYRAEFTPLPGEFWRLKLRLRPPRGSVNFQGRDAERILFAGQTGAVATVLDAEKPRNTGRFQFGIQTLRAGIRAKIRSMLPEGRGRALVLSLAIADRDELDQSDWNVLRVTGTGHLLAISGLHIGLAAVIGFWLFRTGLFLVPGVLSKGSVGFMLCCGGSVLFGLAYAAMAGFPVSSLRALSMLVVALAVLSTRTATGAMQAWWLALIVILILDPMAVFTAGFWLSFGAVLALILFFSPRCEAGKWWLALPQAQFAVMALTLPIGVFWFQSGSYLAFPSNLFSIPLVSFISVPAILASMVALPLPWLSGALLEFAMWSCEFLAKGLDFVASVGGGTVVRTPSVDAFGFMLGAGGGLLLLLPRGLAARWLGLCLVATLFLPRAPALEAGEYSIETLDVGQGLSVLVQTRNHKLLYDTGPGNGQDWSMVDSVIAPALAADGRGGPDIIAVSHADLDHAGGLKETVSIFENAELIFNSPDKDAQIAGCASGRSWTWDGVTFEVLHPTPWLPYLGNDSSCVISIDNGRYRSLLTGDIGSAVEKRLLESMDKYDFITVPHHGSTSSSSEIFVDAVKPALAVVSAAYANRFGFPRADVLQTYERLGSVVLSTIDCGAIAVKFPATGEPVTGVARLSGFKVWRIRPEPSDCMVTPQRAMYHLERP